MALRLTLSSEQWTSNKLNIQTDHLQSTPIKPYRIEYRSRSFAFRENEWRKIFMGDKQWINTWLFRKVEKFGLVWLTSTVTNIWMEHYLSLVLCLLLLVVFRFMIMCKNDCRPKSQAIVSCNKSNSSCQRSFWVNIFDVDRWKINLLCHLWWPENWRILFIWSKFLAMMISHSATNEKLAFLNTQWATGL